MKHWDGEDLYGEYDVIVVGAGHAGCEAAAAAARMGAKTLLATMNLFTVAQMSCNPAIGGLAKGHLVREIDALGGKMAVVTDRTGIQFRMLNRSKGPAVWSPRAQADRMAYSLQMRLELEKIPNLFLKQMVVSGLVIEKGRVAGIRLQTGAEVRAKAVILTAGTFLNGRIFIGLNAFSAGRAGEFPARGISEELVKLGFEIGRLKTGTPPRIDGRTVDFANLIRQPGDEPPPFFSYWTQPHAVDQLPCFLTHTTPETHDILRSGLDRSPLYTGMIQGVGPRYCPSIEDKVVRFQEREHHQIFLEPEGRETQEMYVNGFSSSLPEDIQIRALRTIPGLEKAEITRLGYAIEYDFFPTYQLKANLETKRIEHLFFAGQINGTSGYEEAAAQGLMAGINAVLAIHGEEPFILDRSRAYIGVLIDDLITRQPLEPYRMFTSRAEHRLLLRQDNADLRLVDFAEKYGLLSREQIGRIRRKQMLMEQARARIQEMRMDPEIINPILERSGSPPIENKQPLLQLLRRPEVKLMAFEDRFFDMEADRRLLEEALEQVEIEIKYAGYLERQRILVRKMADLENYRIPPDVDYMKVTGLAKEAQEKLSRMRPETLGQASRIDGVRSSDISVLLIYLEKKRRSMASPSPNQRGDVSRETIKPIRD